MPDEGMVEDPWVVLSGEKEAESQPHCSPQLTEERKQRKKLVSSPW